MTAPHHITPTGETSETADALSIAGLRRELGLTQAEFAERIGLVNKASVSLLERGLTPISLRVALEIERLSDGRIDAATLNADVRLARRSGPDDIALGSQAGTATDGRGGVSGDGAAPSVSTNAGA